MESLPGWGMSSMPGPPTRQHEHESLYTPFMPPFIETRWIWKDDYDGQMIFGDLEGLKLPDICLTGEKKLRKKSHPGNLSRPGIEPGTAAWQARMLPPVPQRWRYVDLKENNFILDRGLNRVSSFTGCCSNHWTIQDKYRTMTEFPFYSYSFTAELCPNWGNVFPNSEITINERIFNEVLLKIQFWDNGRLLAGCRH